MIRWKRSQDSFVDSQDGQWQITPIYWASAKPRWFKLTRVVNGKIRSVGDSFDSQREAKEEAERSLYRESKR
jgi:hypothetical protein